MLGMDADYRKYMLKLVSSINQAIAESDLTLTEQHGEKDLRISRSLRNLLVRTRVEIEEKLRAE
jgi:hypothetical protein